MMTKRIFSALLAAALSLSLLAGCGNNNTPAASGSASDDQRRIMTPAQAVRIGSDFLVVGRPITKAPVPADAARAILDEMEKA